VRKKIKSTYNSAREVISEITKDLYELSVEDKVSPNEVDIKVRSEDVTRIYTVQLTKYAEVAPETLEGPNYIETMSTAFNNSQDTTWQEHSLAAAGAPENALCDIMIVNTHTSQKREGGVREVGSSLARKFDLNGGAMVCMQVKADLVKKIEIYSEDKTSIDFYLVGYEQ